MYCSPTMPPPAVPCGRSAIRSEPESLAISPDGSTLFVAGTSLGVGGKKNNVLLAYDAATGSPLWSKRYRSASVSMAVSPDGSRVFVTGYGPGRSFTDYVTEAF